MKNKEERRQQEPKPHVMTAIKTLLPILQTGQWMKKSTLEAILGAKPKSLGPVIRMLGYRYGLAESDSGYYVALVNDETPEYAPDEKEPARTARGA